MSDARSYGTYRNYPTGKCAMDWGDFTHQRLWWLYGPERALEIARGNDPATLTDLEAWARLGRRAAA